MLDLIKKYALKYIPSPLLRVVLYVYSRLRYRENPRFKACKFQDVNVLMCVISYNSYGGYCVPRNSMQRPAAQAILRGEVWESETIEFIAKHCRGGDILHAGTYFGDFLPALSRAVSVDGMVWAFEPNIENYRCAIITQQINGLENVCLTNAGLGESKDNAFLITHDENGVAMGGASMVAAEKDCSEQDSLQVVDIVSIDSMVPSDRNIKVIHLDVEGYEKQVLMGGIQTIRRCQPILILETFSYDVWFENNIASLGYVVTGDVHGNYILKIL